MAEARSAASPRLAARIRDSLRAAHRELVLWRAVRRFRADPAACADPRHPLLTDLIRGWGNPHWGAHEEFLAAAVEQALRTDGPILECGSGLSTIVLGAIAERQRRQLWSLEHKPEWEAKTRRHLRRHRLDNVTLCVAPLRKFGSFDWYDPPLDSLPERFSLVVCDGPPGGTKGGRYGLVPVLKDRFAPACVLLLDDAQRNAEVLIARRWAAEMRSSFIVAGAAKPYIVMITPPR